MKKFKKNSGSVQKRQQKVVAIPSFQPDFVQTLVSRFYVPSSAGSTKVSVSRELPIAPYGVSYTAIAAYLPFKAIRLSRVRMWCNYRPDQDIGSNTINLTIADRRTCRPMEVSDTASFSQLAYISKKFDKFDPVGLWYITATGETNPELTFQLPAGGVLELTYNFILSDNDAVPSVVIASSSFPRVITNRLSTSFEPIGKSHYAVLDM